MSNTSLPEGMVAINSAAGVYRYIAPHEMPDDPDYVDFVIYRDGSVEVASAGAPIVPAIVLAWVAEEANRRDAPCR